MNDVAVTRITSLVDEVAALPWVWPGEPTAEAAEVAGAGTCASKHALLRRELGALGVLSRPMFVAGALVPSILAEDPNLADAADLIEVHELLVVSVPEVGPCRVDVTWDPPLIRAGLPGQLGWDGGSDMAVAVGTSDRWWVPDPDDARAEKELLRRRLYRPGERERRDAALGIVSDRLQELRGQPVWGSGSRK